jgi:hypothetical protein
MPEHLKAGLKRIFPWLLGIAYLPSFLVAPVPALEIYSMRHNDCLLVSLALYTAVSYALPICLLWIYRNEQRVSRRWPRVVRIVTWVVALNCVPHTIVVMIWGLMAGIGSDGLVT